MKTRLSLQTLEDRDVPAVTVADASEAFAWALINDMRQDPAGFANKLDALRRGTAGAFGFAKNDPVVADIQRLFTYSTWPGHYTQALAMLRSAAAVGPLAWDDVLEDRAGVHVDWMKTHSFEHTDQDNPGKSYVAGYKTGYTGGDPDDWGYEPGRYYWWGEDIGYTYGLMNNSKAAYAAGKFGAVGFQQRAAFIDTISYVIEVNSPAMYHLEQLLRSDAAPDWGTPHFNAIGIDVDFYEGPSEAKDGFGEATISTHRFGLYRPEFSGGFLAGLFFSDANGNDYFDAGEGISATVAVSGPVSFTESVDRLGSFGVYSHYLPNGSYTVTTTAADGTPLGTKTATINNANAWVEFDQKAVTAGETSGDDSRTPAAAPIIPVPVPPVIPMATSSEGIRPTFTWPAVPGATGYEFKLSVRPGWALVFRVPAANVTEWTPPKDLVSGVNYRFSVRALSPGKVGAWASHDFTVAKPQAEIATVVTSLRPTATWAPVPGATSYAILVNDLTTGRTNVLPGQFTTDTTWAAPFDLVSGRSYSIQVRTRNSRGQGYWGAADRFSVATATMYGSTATPDLRPTLAWSVVEGAKQFLVELVDATTGRKTVYRLPGSVNVWSPPTDLVVGHIYKWRVATLNSAGIGNWAPAQQFKVTL